MESLRSSRRVGSESGRVSGPPTDRSSSLKTSADKSKEKLFGMISVCRRCCAVIDDFVQRLRQEKRDEPEYIKKRKSSLGKVRGMAEGQLRPAGDYVYPVFWPRVCCVLDAARPHCRIRGQYWCRAVLYRRTADAGRSFCSVVRAGWGPGGARLAIGADRTAIHPLVLERTYPLCFCCGESSRERMVCSALTRLTVAVLLIHQLRVAAAQRSPHSGILTRLGLR